MSQAEVEGGTRAGAGQVTNHRAARRPPGAGRPAFARRRSVLIVALVLIVAQLAWKAHLLSGQYFRADDFRDLDLAIEHPLNWAYLSYNWAGHLIIGPRAAAWILVRTSLYNWGLASAFTLAFTLAADLACYRALRVLFGEGPRILIPLTFYLLTPLAAADLGWWSAAMEAVPLQLAIFMAVTAHVHYVRAGRRRHLAAAGFWLGFGLIFSAKALVLPVILFVLTAGFLIERRSSRAGAATALKGFWRAWVVYAGLAACYAVILASALRTAVPLPRAPLPSGGVPAFAGNVLKESLLPSVFGGPWLWHQLPGSSLAVAAPPPFLAWLCVVLAVVIAALMVIMRRAALLAWLALAIWVFAADFVPLFLGRIVSISPALLGLDPGYAADVAAVLVICVGLACWPVVAGHPAARQPQRRVLATFPRPVRRVIAGLAAVVVVSSVWSVRQLESTIGGTTARSYIANATEAMRLAPRGTLVYDRPVPAALVPRAFGPYSRTAKVIGDLAIGKMHWISKLSGNIDKVYWVGADGQLHQVWVGPTSSLTRPKAAGCWPERRGQVVVRFPAATPSSTSIIRIGYLAGASSPAAVTVIYGASARPLRILPGLHSAFLPESGGRVNSIKLAGLGASHICVGDAEAGQVESSPFAEPIQ